MSEGRHRIRLLITLALWGSVARADPSAGNIRNLTPQDGEDGPGPFLYLLMMYALALVLGTPLLFIAYCIRTSVSGDGAGVLLSSLRLTKQNIGALFGGTVVSMMIGLLVVALPGVVITSIIWSMTQGGADVPIEAVMTWCCAVALGIGLLAGVIATAASTDV